MTEFKKLEEEVEEYKGKLLLTDHDRKILEFMSRLIKIFKNKKKPKSHGSRKISS